MPETKKLFLLDAMALIFRAFYAMNKNPRINSKGVNTGAILGFANSLYDILRNEKPTHIGVVFDAPGPTVRHDDFTDYKAHREEAPEDLKTAIPYIIRLVEAFNIPVLLRPGYEADDIIGTLTKQAEQKGFTTYMMTSDKDFGQLVSEHSLIYKPGRAGEKAEILGVKEVCEKFGIKDTARMIDILGLWGDASDNIPGVPGVGEMTAKKLIGEFGTLENVLANAHTQKGKLRENLENFASQALMSKQLATIILDAPVDFDEEALAVVRPDEEKLRQLFDELEFRAFAKRVFTDLSPEQAQGTGEAQPVQGTLFDETAGSGELQQLPGEMATIHTTPHEYILADTAGKRAELLSLLKKQESFCFDTETTGLDPNTSELVGMSFSVEPHKGWFVTLPGNYNEALEIVKEFKPVFEDENIGKAGQNLKFDIAMLRWYDVEVKGKLFDTMLAHYLLQPDMRHNMDLLAETYLHYRPVPIEALIGKKGKGQLSMRQVDLELLKEYAAEDADITLQLRGVFAPKLDQDNVRGLFDEIETPLVPVLASMEREGIRLDKKALADYSVQLGDEITELEKEIYTLAGVTFNIASPRQLGEILFEKLRIMESPSKTKTQQYSTGEEILVKLVNKHPVIRKILDYRSLTKLKSTYVDTLPEMVNPRTGRIHSSFNQAVAATGRLSSNNPNLQNIPVRTERGREIRKAFVPRNDNYTLVSADYSQIELRIIAGLSGDEGLCEDFRKGLDIHAATASKVYGVKLDEVTREMRRNAKMVNFGIIYGISAFGLAERLGIPRSEASDIIRQYFIQYPGIKRYMDQTIAFARKNGYVETVMKRRRYLRDINSGNAVVRGFAERNAINAPIQGSAADMIKIAMIGVHREISHRKLKSRMILQVHDELVFDASKDELEVLVPLIEEKMRTALPFSVPIVVETGTGANWLEAH